MTNSLQSLINSGTKLYLDSVEPSEVDQNLAWGAVGATSNPAIISGIVKTGLLDSRIEQLISLGQNDESVAWSLTDELVSDAERKFAEIHEQTAGNAGWVSFELDPLLEDPSLEISHDVRVAKYIELGRQWGNGHPNRMIKVPASKAGLAALEPLAAAGVTLNVTLIFTATQYEAARDAIWRGAQQRVDGLEQFKSVYSIFISRIDVYTDSTIPDLSPAAQGWVGTTNAKLVWQANREFWADKPVKLEQELIFASTGTKKPEDAPWKYVEALAGSDIQTNPPATNEAVATSGVEFSRQVDQLPPAEVLAEIAAKVDSAAMQEVLMAEGVAKFVKPQNELLQSIATKRQELAV